ncbi:MAG TPA: cupin domain-containing protein [Burkholderiales bacterium]|nr:cupin domain-containing protein [Burkholderiales bacterium]
MGKLVDYRKGVAKEIGPGVGQVAITGGEGKHMQADVLRLQANGRLEAAVPARSDQYFYVLSGEAVLTVDRDRYVLGEGRFGMLQEGKRYTIAGSRAPVEVLSVLAPPPASSADVPGFTGGVKVMLKDAEPLDDIPAQKKQRIYFVTPKTCGSKRAHAMIVKYVPETETTLHAHPDAESLFVFLDGTTRVTVNGSESRVTLGQAAFFPCGDNHSLHGDTGRSNFLEFHVPYGYTTVR